MSLTRRDFITGAIGASIGCVPALAACSPTSKTSAESETNSSETAATQGTSYSFEIPPQPIEESEIAETFEADVVVVGGGTAGLCTAVSAQQSGCSVILVSASKAPVSRGGSNHAAYSRVMEENGVPRYDVDRFFRKEFLVGGYTADQRKWFRFYNNSEEAMNWALDVIEPYGGRGILEGSPEGIDETDPMFTPVASHCFVDDEITSPSIGQSILVNALAKTLENEGGSIYWQNIGRQLVRGGVANGTEGRVEAVIAEREDGSYAKYAGKKAVVLATGDFSKDPEMMEKYCPWAIPTLVDVDVIDYDIGLFNGSLMPGDGHKMGLWIGAAWQKNVPNAAMIGGNGVNNFCNQPLLGHTGLMVNIRGERYSNEFACGALSNRNALMQTDGRTFMIWGQNYLEEGGPWYTYPRSHGDAPVSNEQTQEKWDKFVENGAWFKCDTLEELCEKLELPKETLDTIARYNELCEKGVDEDFHKDAQYMIPIKDAPYYGFENSVRFLTVLGGLNTDQYMRVCNAKDEPIPGLYNVGTMVGDFFSSVYTFMAEGSNYGACCLTFGYLTGKYIAENE
ncbi:FAD-binding protein [Eggerthella sp. YY7918]|uniref:FAD-binding protein n=1 Tax=Eggerthella sp. (strain YY7918) TaxID=502558 RepID=UPI00021718F7|nr:FAD-binding protein [Eggerthella sp. YY7918]BAK45704.1 hypothetical protein EGYY_27070 [Eggerthella sp. YY7918]